MGIKVLYERMGSLIPVQSLTSHKLEGQDDSPMSAGFRTSACSSGERWEVELPGLIWWGEAPVRCQDIVNTNGQDMGNTLAKT
jgi:hypothetical protein